MVLINQEINYCDQCPYGETQKVYTLDSFDNIRKVYCKKLEKDVHEYLDWNDKADIPEECPFKTN